MHREVYQHNLRLYGPTHEKSLVTVCNLAQSLLNMHQYEESVRIARRHAGPAQKKFGADHHLVLKLQQLIATSCVLAATSRKEVTDALNSMRAVYERRLRVFGAAHPQTKGCEEELAEIREMLGGL